MRVLRLDRRYRKEAIAALHLRPGQTVLDVACGTGLDLPYLFEGVGEGGRIVAVDVAPRMIDRANARARTEGITNVELVLGDVCEVEIPEVDAVAACMCMVTIADHRGALDRVVGRLRPGGRIAILDYKRMSGPSGQVFNWIAEPKWRITHQDISREPWRDLERLLGHVHVREWKHGSILGSVYLASAQKPRRPAG